MSNLVKQIIIGAVAFIIIGVAVGFGVTMLSGFESMRNATTSDTDIETLQVPAASGSANHTTSELAETPFGGIVAAITSVTSNVSGDVLSAASVSGDSVNITGYPNTSANRTVTVVYNRGTVEQYTGLNNVIEFGPVIILLGFIIVVGIVGFLGIRMVGKQ